MSMQLQNRDGVDTITPMGATGDKDGGIVVNRQKSKDRDSKDIKQVGKVQDSVNNKTDVKAD